MSKELYKDYINGLSISELANKYKVSKTRVYKDIAEYSKEQGKVFGIIIKKNVSVWGFRNRVFGYQKKQNGNITINDTYEYYLNNFGCYHNGFDIELITEDEFNLLKEWL